MSNSAENSAPAVHVPSLDQVQLERFITYRLSVLSNTLSRQMERFLNKQFGVSLPDWRVLAVLGRYHQMSVRELAARSKMDKALVSRVASRLVKQGLINSTPHAEDKRLVVLTLTGAGREMYSAIVPWAKTRHQKLLGCLTEDEVSLLERALDKLTSYAQEIEQRSRGDGGETIIY